jgi:hypothetical protein
MNHITAHSHRSLSYVLFALFEILLLSAVLVIWSFNPRRMSWVEDAAGITACFSMVGLSIVSWLLRRAAPRVARVGWISVLAGLAASCLLPAVP